MGVGEPWGQKLPFLFPVNSAPALQKPVAGFSLDAVQMIPARAQEPEANGVTTGCPGPSKQEQKLGGGSRGGGSQVTASPGRVRLPRDSGREIIAPRSVLFLFTATYQQLSTPTLSGIRGSRKAVPPSCARKCPPDELRALCPAAGDVALAFGPLGCPVSGLWVVTYWAPVIAHV